MPIRIEHFVSRQFDQNAYVVRAADSRTAVVIDPGFETAALLRHLESEGIRVEAILLTHGHVDHIAGVAAVRRLFPDAPILIGLDDAAMLTDANLNLSAAFGVPITAPPADRFVSHGEELAFAGLTLGVRDLPGHSLGHVVFTVDGEVFAGDTLFAGSVGRSDFPGGSHALLIAGIRSQLLSLPDATRVHPGHGAATTVGAERRGNGFLVSE